MLCTDKLNTQEVGWKSSVDFEDHLLICGMDPEIDMIVSVLRSKHLEASNLIRKIVILSPVEPSTASWFKISLFPDVYYVQGSACKPDDLHRCNVEKASRILVLSSGPSGSGTDTITDYSEAEWDSKPIMAFRIIQQLTAATVMIEMSMYSIHLKDSPIQRIWTICSFCSNPVSSCNSPNPLVEAQRVTLKSIKRRRTNITSWNPIPTCSTPTLLLAE